MSFSENLKTAMDNNNISQYRMSQETGISQSLISEWRRGVKKPGADHIKTICEYLGESADVLLEIKVTTNSKGGVDKTQTM